MIGIILAAGNGERLKNSIGHNICKPLVKVNKSYLIEFSLNNMVELGISKTYIVVGSNAKLISQALGCKYKGMTIEYVVQKRTAGLINAFVTVIKTLECIDDTILSLADEIFISVKTDEIKKIISSMSSDFYCGFTYENEVKKILQNYSIETDQDSNITNCTEKPSAAPNNMKGTGFCIFRRDALKYLIDIYDDDINYPDTLCDFFNSMISIKKYGRIFCVAEKEFNINTVEDMVEATKFIIQ